MTSSSTSSPASTSSIDLTQRRSRTLKILVALIALIAVLHYSARFGLGGPDLATNDGLSDWLSDPVNVVATFARWVALVLSYYLAVVVAAFGFLGANWDADTLSRFGPRSVVGLVGLLLGVSAVAVPVATRYVAASPAPPAPLVLLKTETLTLTEVDTAETPAPPSNAQTLSVQENETENNTSSEPFWLVTNGESFWSIATEHLSDELARTDLTEQQIAEYWRILIEANEDRLVDPHNADLILPGQELFLPKVPTFDF